MRKTIATLCSGLLLCALLVAGGCGGDDDDDTSPSATVPGDDDITLTGDDDASLGDDDATTPGDDTATPVPPSPTPNALPEGEYLILVPDNQANLFRVIDPYTDTQVYLLDLADVNPELCTQIPMGCLIAGGYHQLVDGHDHLDVAYGLAGANGLRVGFVGQLQRILMTDPPETRWTLSELDFSGLPDGPDAYCAADPEDPCKPDPDAPEELSGLCHVGDAHDFIVLSDDSQAQTAELLVTGTDTYRMYKVRLDYSGGNTCGKVTAYIDHQRNPEWPEYTQANNLIAVPDDERELYIINFRSIESNHNRSGIVQLWEITSDGQWVSHWTFPEQPDDGSMHFFRMPHGGDLEVDGSPDGHIYRLCNSAAFAESDDYTGTNPPGGSCPALLLRDFMSTPDYLHDLYQPEDVMGWAFPRQVTHVGDGTLIVTDSGCQAASMCPYTPRLIWLDDVETLNSSKGGYWTETFDQYELLDQTPNVLKVLECGLVNPYWVDVIHSDDYGPEILSALASGGIPCPR